MCYSLFYQSYVDYQEKIEYFVVHVRIACMRIGCDQTSQ
jgi:hypothetical protein